MRNQRLQDTTNAPPPDRRRALISSRRAERTHAARCSRRRSAASNAASVGRLHRTALRCREASEGGHCPTGVDRQLLSLAGRDDLIVDQIYAPFARPYCDPLTRNGRPIDPLTEITNRTKSSGRLVIVNEAHDDPQTRTLILDLLTPLHDQEFSVYAAETFTPAVGMHAPKWPLLSDGFYSYEPTFGNVIRRARALGFAFVPYEAQTQAGSSASNAMRIAHRETEQTRNIMARIITAMPGARALIHVGHHHVIEAPVGESGNGLEWMASRLKAASGIDPLTIDQTTFQSPLDRPVICALAAESDKKRALTTDLAVALPRPLLKRGRPTWRRARGQIEVEVPAGLRTGTWSIIEARRAAEPNEAVPADRILLGPNEDLPLLLDPGKYRVEAWTPEAGWSQTIDIVAR